MAYSPYDSNGNATSFYNSSFETGKIPSTDAPRIKDVAENVLEFCKDFGKKALQVSAEVYLEYKSFENGVNAAVIRNIGQPGTDLFGVLENIITGKTTIANRIQSSLNAKIHYYEQNSYDKVMFNVGKVTGNAAGIAADILLTISSGGATAGMSIVARSGDALVLASAGAKLLEAGVLLDAAKNGSALGNDLKDLISSIKGEDGAKHMIGENGTQVSKTLWENNKIGHIDVENPSPGKRPGQIHYQDINGNKWYYDIEKNIL